MVAPSRKFTEPLVMVPEAGVTDAESVTPLPTMIGLDTAASVVVVATCAGRTGKDWVHVEPDTTMLAE